MKEGVRIIISAGMPRSGSTWLYNAVRLLLGRDRNDQGSLTCGWCEDLKLEEQEGDVLVKIHVFDERFASRASLVLYSYRDIRDAMASYKRKFGGEPTIKMADYFVRNDSLWRNISQYNMCYEKMIIDPLVVLGEIASVLGADCKDDLKDILSEINSLKYNDGGNNCFLYNKENLLHENHITDGGSGRWHDCLDREFVSLVEATYYDWFIDNNYEVHSCI